MSRLSPQECTAGISRAALAISKKHGSNGDTPHTPKPAEPARDPMSGQRESRVIDTPFRQLSILESRDGEITLRNAEFVGTKCDLALIHLDGEQTRTLGLALLKCAHREDA